jgi:uncharacterized protein
MRAIVNILATLCAVFVLVVVAAWLGQRRLLYFPDTRRIAPGDVGLRKVTEHEIAAPDGTFTIAWWARAAASQPTIVYFHGNAAGLAAREPRVTRVAAEGWGMYMMSYRGFSGAPGSPTEADNVADAIRALDWLEAQGVRRHSVVLYGESLGTGVATQVAVARPGIRGLVLDAPYTSAVDVGKRRYPFLPVEWAMRDRYETKRFIGRVTSPVLILHGARDAVIPVEMGREVARLANEPKRYIEFPNGGHLDLFINGNDGFAQLKAWIEALPGGGK